MHVIPLGVLISLLVSTGPYIQYHLVGVLNSDAPSIYDAVYKQGVARFPTFWEWLLFAAYPQYLAIGLLAAHFGLLRRRLWPVLATIALWTGALLTLLDVGNTVIGHAAPADLPVSVVANGLGGALVALIVGFALPLFDRLPKAFPETREAALWGAAASTILLGLSLSYLLWYALYFFFQPVPVAITVVLDPPVRGFIGGVEDNKSKLLNFLPREAIPADLELTASGGQAKLDWKASPTQQGYTLTAQLVANCYDPNLTKLKLAVSPMVWRNVRQVTVNWDPGMATLKGHNEQATRYGFNKQLPMIFWFQRTGKDEVEATYFVLTHESLSASTNGGTTLLMSGELMRFDRSNSYAGIMSPRRLTLTVNGKSKVIDFQHQGQPAKRASCTPINQQPSADQTTINTPYAQAGLLFSLAPSKLDADRYDERASGFTLSGVDGWVRVSPIPELNLVNGELGSTDVMGFSGKPLLLELDGQPQVTNEFDQLTVVGHLDGSVLTGRRVKFDGNARVVFRGGQRLSPTKWERWPIVLQMALLPTLIAILGFFIRVLWWPAVRDLRDEDVNSWT